MGMPMPDALITKASVRVAIVGGGIGGICTAIGLLKYPHIDVQVYESAPNFSEIGAGVGIGPNAQQALDLVAPEARAAYDKHASGNLWPEYAKSLATFIVGEGKQEGKIIHQQINATGQQSVHRAHFLDELVKIVPCERAHFNKRVSFLEEEHNGPVTIHFKDGTTATADAVIGADGIHSTVRAHLLGDELAKPVFAGSAVYRSLVPMDKAVEKLGAEYAGNSFFLCGNGKGFMSYPIENGTLSNIVIFNFEFKSWDHDKWVIPAEADYLRGEFSNWGAKAQALVNLFLETHDPSLWALWDHAPAPTYTKNCIAIMGDAAHATTPYQGQGAGQAIEDAAVLSTLLGSVTSLKQIPNAFLAYDQVRRVRTQRVVSTSRDAGNLIAMKHEGVGGDLEKMSDLLSYRVHWIWNRDLREQNREAVQLFKESL